VYDGSNKEFIDINRISRTDEHEDSSMNSIINNNKIYKTANLFWFTAILLALPILLYGFYRRQEITSRAGGRTADIVVDPANTIGTVDTSFYHAFAQGGEEKSNMLAAVLPEITALNPRYIRLDHIYDFYDVVRSEAGQLAFDFSRLDPVIDSIKSTGAKPLLSLSYMPSAIARDANIINPPINWEDWAIVVQKTIEHYSGRSAKNFSDVIYEVWNEPDLPQFGGWRIGGKKDYLTLYDYAARGAKRASGVNKFLLCGPATANLSKHWITSLAASGLRVDCLTWHVYYADPILFRNQRHALASWLSSYPRVEKLPRIITEFGFTGDKDIRYSSQFAVAYTAAAVRQVLDQGITYLFSFQLKDGPAENTGAGWGLIEHESKGKNKKPRYYVYNLLDEMAGTRINLIGEGSWVTGFASVRDQTIRTILVNFDPNGLHNENVPIRFRNLDPGRYEYRVQFLTNQDLRDTEEVTRFVPVINHKIYLPAQSVVLIELKKL